MADKVDLGGVWTAATDELADEIVSAQQRAYLRLTRLRAIVEDTALLSVPDAFTRDVIESRLRPAITDALSRRMGRPIQVAVTVRPPEDGSGRPGTVYGSPPGAEDSGYPPNQYADNSYGAPQYADRGQSYGDGQSYADVPHYGDRYNAPAPYGRPGPYGPPDHGPGGNSQQPATGFPIPGPNGGPPPSGGSGDGHGYPGPTGSAQHSPAYPTTAPPYPAVEPMPVYSANVPSARDGE